VSETPERRAASVSVIGLAPPLMEEERKFFAGRRLPIIPMTPGVVPEELVEG
jgi:hypothetical protein